MTAEYGDFANINVERVVQQAQQQASKVVGMQDRIASLEGRAESKDGYIKVVCDFAQGIRELEINPRAMRMGSADLADTIKQLIKEANEDLQRKMREEIANTFAGQGNPMDYLDDPSKATAKIQELQSVLETAMGDVSSHMEQMRKRLGM